MGEDFLLRWCPPAKISASSHGNPFRAVAGLPQIAEGEMAMIRPMGTVSGRRASASEAWPELPPQPNRNEISPNRHDA